MLENFRVRVRVSEIFRDSPNDQICRSSGYNLQVSVGMCVAASLFTALIQIPTRMLENLSVVSFQTLCTLQQIPVDQKLKY